MTQHQKIINMCKDGSWHCQTEFWNLHIFSPHKRRTEIENGETRFAKPNEYLFEERPCIHGIRGSKDFRLNIYKKIPQVVYNKDGSVSFV